MRREPFYVREISMNDAVRRVAACVGGRVSPVDVVHDEQRTGPQKTIGHQKCRAVDCPGLRAVNDTKIKTLNWSACIDALAEFVPQIPGVRVRLARDGDVLRQSSAGQQLLDARL